MFTQVNERIVDTQPTSIPLLEIIETLIFFASNALVRFDANAF